MVRLLVAFAFTTCTFLHTAEAALSRVDVLTPLRGATIGKRDFNATLAGSLRSGSVRVLVNSTPQAASLYNVAYTPLFGAGVVTGSMDSTLLVAGRYNTLRVEATASDGKTIHDEVNFIYAPGSSTLLNNTISGVTGRLDPSRVVDVVGPAVAIVRPAMGGFAPLDQQTTIEGTASDNLALAGLTLEVDLDGPVNVIGALDPGTGRFAIPWTSGVAGLHRLVVTATDTAGNESSAKVSVYVGTPMKAGSTIQRAAVAVVDSRGFRHMGKLIEMSMTPQVMFGRLPKPTWRGRARGVKSEISVERAGHSGMTLDLSIGGPGYLNMQAVINGFYVQLISRIKTSVKKLKNKGFARVDQAVYNGRLYLSKERGKPVSISVSEVGLTLQGFRFKIKGLPGGLAKTASRYFDSFIKENLEATLSDQIPRRIGEYLNDFFSVGEPLKINLLGLDFLVKGELANFAIDGRTSTFDSDTSIVADRADPAPGGRTEFLTTPNPEQLAGLVSRNDMTAAVSDDVINQAFYEVWRVGGLDITLEKLRSNQQLMDLTVAALNATLGVTLFKDGQLIPANLPAEIEVKPLLPPVVVCGRGGYLMQVQLHEALVKIFFKQGTRKIEVFSFVLDVDMPIDSLTVDRTKDIMEAKMKDVSFGFRTRGGASIDFRFASLPAVKIPFSQVFPLLETVTKMIMPFLLKILENKAFEQMSRFDLDEIVITSLPDHLVMSGRLLYPANRYNGGPPVEVSDTGELTKAVGLCGLTRIAGGGRILDGYRDFRDRILYPFPGGVALAHLYYALSVNASEWLAANRWAVFFLYIPVAALGLAFLVSWWFPLFVVLAGGTMLAWRARLRPGCGGGNTREFAGVGAFAAS